MTVKEFLRQYEYADRKIRRLEKEYEEQRIMIDSIRSASDNDGMPHGSNIGRPTEDKAIRLADKLQELASARLDAIEARQIVFDAICDVPGLEGEILYARYIQLLKWEDVASAVHVSRQTAYKYHGRALELVRIK